MEKFPREGHSHARGPKERTERGYVAASRPTVLQILLIERGKFRSKCEGLGNIVHGLDAYPCSTDDNGAVVEHPT